MAEYENEVFDGTVGTYTRETLDRWGADLADKVAATCRALEASDVAIELEITVTAGGGGKAELKRRTSTVVWRSEEELRELDAKFEDAEGPA